MASQYVGATAAKCLECEREGKISLDCEPQHKLCRKCLLKNIARFGLDEDSAYTCPQCAAPTDPPPIWIFVDNSNIWIEAQKFTSKVKKFQSLQDHRVRISIGHLTDVVANNREVKKGTLYGSEPPKIDYVWDKIREHGWEVKTKKKSFLTHKEKEVDAQLLVDVTEVVCNTPLLKRSTIILITGDADMCPAVEKIIEYDGWKVEIYMWEQALSDRLKRLSKENPSKVFCQYLDSHLSTIVFTNKRFSQDYIPNDSSAVLKIEPGVFSHRTIGDTPWWSQLETVAQWPVTYGWMIQDEKETDYLLLVFHHRGESRKYNVSAFVKKINDCKASGKPILDHVQQAETYIDYKKRPKKYKEAVLYGNFYDPDDLEPKSIPVSKHSTTTTSQWKSVPPSSKVGGQHKMCRLGKNCQDGLSCKYKHCDSDRDYFKRNGGKGNRLRKAKQCDMHPKCPRTAAECNFAHGERDAWCLNCRHRGHFSQSCPNSA